MTTQAYVDSATALLHRLSGRLLADTVDLRWSRLRAGEYTLFEDTIFGQLEVERVGLAPDEIELFRGLLDDPDDWRLGEIERV